MHSVNAAPATRTAAHNKKTPTLDSLGDFTANKRLLPVSVVAIGIGIVSAFVALALLKLISLFTNIFFYHRWSVAAVSPAGHHLGIGVVLVPVVGALIIG